MLDKASRGQVVRWSTGAEVSCDKRLDMRPPLSAHQALPIIKRIPKRSEAVDGLEPIAAARLGAMGDGNNR